MALSSSSQITTIKLCDTNLQAYFGDMLFITAFYELFWCRVFCHIYIRIEEFIWETPKLDGRPVFAKEESFYLNRKSRKYTPRDKAISSKVRPIMANSYFQKDM